MFNKRGQELNPGGLLMGIVGGIVAFVMSGMMGAGILYRGLTGIVTAIACYILVSGIAR